MTGSSPLGFCHGHPHVKIGRRPRCLRKSIESTWHKLRSWIEERIVAVSAVGTTGPGYEEILLRPWLEYDWIP